MKFTAFFVRSVRFSPTHLHLLLLLIGFSRRSASEILHVAVYFLSNSDLWRTDIQTATVFTRHSLCGKKCCSVDCFFCFRMMSPVPCALTTMTLCLLRLTMPLTVHSQLLHMLVKLFSLFCIPISPSVPRRCWLVGRKSIQPVKKTERWGAGMDICLKRGADLHTAQLMPLPLTASCFSKIQIGFTYLVLAHLGSLGQRDVKRVCYSFFALYSFLCLILVLKSCCEALVHCVVFGRTRNKLTIQ